MMDWKRVIKRIKELSVRRDSRGNSVWVFGQADTISWMSEQLGKPERNGVLIADEVGMGKTRVTMAAILAVLENNGNVLVVVPPGLLKQWKKEWEDFLSSLNEKRNFSPVILRSYFNLFEKSNLDVLLDKKNPKWVLISHQFGLPRLSNNSQMHRYWLPILAAAIRRKTDGLKGRNRFWETLMTEGWINDCLAEKCDNCGSNMKFRCQGYDIQVKRAAEYLAKKRPELFRNLPPIPNAESAKQFYESGKGWQMITDLLGSYNLVVIDEAHKNKNETSKLGSILSEMRLKTKEAKFIGMTATPMELNAAQWENIFIRIKEPFPRDIINRFSASVIEANKFSQNRSKIEELIKASKEFNNALNPYVTRRLRIKQKEMRDILGLSASQIENTSHPHREWPPITIGYAQVEDNWKPSIFALEALGKAAKGCKTKDPDINRAIGKLKIYDSRYAAGLIEEKHLIENQITEDQKFSDEKSLSQTLAAYLKDNAVVNEDKATIGKLHRILFWLRKINKTKGTLANHPRILTVADEIDKLIWEENGKLKIEKVLVFGVFKKPLHVLQDVLNARAILRFLDRKLQGTDVEFPIPAVKKCLENIDNLWEQYHAIKSTPVVSLKRRYSTPDDLRTALINGGKSYDALRNLLTTYIDIKFVQSLPGYEPVIGFENEVAELLRIRVIDELICRGETFITGNPNEIKNKALNYWRQYLEAYLNKENGSGEMSSKTDWVKPKYFNGSKSDEKNLIELDRLAENVGKNELTTFISNESYELTTRLSFFARMLDGGVPMETRSGLQAQFNSKFSFPQVLIAQSQVGREGLNLHKRCRTIIQFHSEWNPGVIEQQVGRVDRIQSFWEELAKKFREDNPVSSISNDIEFPKILIRPVIFKGTYDDFQFQVSKQRRDNLNAHLFGELLSEEALEKMPDNNPEWQVIRKKLKESAPNFSPPATL